MELYNHQALNELTYLGFGFLLLSLGVVRTLAVKFSPGENRSVRE